ncbi:hypothetical protein JOQ06_017323, partial [Pogonophryne albipinna]
MCVALFTPLSTDIGIGEVNYKVMNVNLSEGDKVVFEDVGQRENSMLANESILMRGLVIRSHSNQISIRFHSQMPQVGSALLRYQ